MTTAVQKSPVATLAAALENAKPRIAKALPAHMTPERMVRIALTAAQRTPKLLEAEQLSFLLAVIQCAETGLEPNVIGHSYLVPFRNGKTGKTEVQFIPGYKGLLMLARRSGQISTIDADIVRQGDHFVYRKGLDPILEHIPAETDDGDIKFAYAVAILKDGGKQFVVLPKAKIEKVRSRSKAADTGPWSTDYEEMCKKTVLRRLCKLLPCSIEIERAVAYDERAEAGLSPASDILDLGEIEIAKPLSTTEELNNKLGSEEKL